jgi:O-antigen ligase
MPLTSEHFWRRKDRYNLAVLTFFVMLLLFFGGASRVDVVGQAIVRVAAVIVLASGAMQINREGWLRVKVPLMFMALLACTISVQLVPLPPGIWSSLPGRSVYSAPLAAIGADQAWRAASLTPDRTLNSLLALLPPAAALVTCCLLSKRFQSFLLTLLLVAIAFSTLLGVFQIATGGPYLYAVTNKGSAVGSFANRNHAALFLALAFPLMMAWLLQSEREHRRPGFRTWVALSAGIAIIPILLVIGSRGGLLLGGVGIVLALLIEYRSRPLIAGSRRLLILFTAFISAVAAVSVFAFFSRAEAFERLFGNDAPELRSNLLPVFLKMIEDYFPVGSGFGSFEHVYRMYEPLAFLGPTYLNQAHNDPAQILIEGGLLAPLLIVAFAAWYMKRTIEAWRSQTGSSIILARAASVAISMIAIGSCFDYPLRTPLMAVTASIMLVWLVNQRDDREVKAPGANEGRVS